jgi:thioredoxin 1
MTKELSSKSEFESAIKDGTVLVDFYADWCMPCVMMSPVIDEMGNRFKGKIKFAKINVDENQEIAQRFGVMSIPNFVLFRDGKMIGQIVGGMSEEDFENKLKKFV